MVRKLELGFPVLLFSAIRNSSFDVADKYKGVESHGVFIVTASKSRSNIGFVYLSDSEVLDIMQIIQFLYELQFCRDFGNK